MRSIKFGELLEIPKSRNRYNVTGNGERDSMKSVADWVISSQASAQADEGSTTREKSRRSVDRPKRRTPDQQQGEDIV